MGLRIQDLYAIGRKKSQKPRPWRTWGSQLWPSPSWWVQHYWVPPWEPCVDRWGRLLLLGMAGASRFAAAWSSWIWLIVYCVFLGLLFSTHSCYHSQSGKILHVFPECVAKGSHLNLVWRLELCSPSVARATAACSCTTAACSQWGR